jgi:hypothetical protein
MAGQWDVGPREDSRKHAPERVREEAPTPTLPDALLALQEGAGNAAVARMMVARDSLTELRSRATGQPVEELEAEEARVAPIRTPGAVAQAEAAALHVMGPAPGQERKLEKMLAHKAELGPQDDPVATIQQEKADRAAAEAERLRAKEESRQLAEARRQQLTSQYAGQRAEHATKHEAEVKGGASAEAERQKRADEWERSAPAHTLRVKATTLVRRIGNASSDIKAKLPAKLASKAQAVADAAPTADELELRRRVQSVEEMTAEFELYERADKDAKKSKAQNRLRTMRRDDVLATMLTYAAPELKTANDAVVKAEQRDDWFEVTDLLPALETAFKAFKPLYTEAELLPKRVTYVKNYNTTNGLPNTAAPIVAADALVAIRKTLAPDALEEQVGKVGRELRPLERPIAKAEFRERADLEDWAGATAVLSRLYDNGLVRQGVFNSRYRTNWDSRERDEFSVEYTVDGIDTIVIHSHCHSTGAPKAGGNMSHWKPKGLKFAPGVSHPIPNELRDKLIGPPDEILAKPLSKA